MGKNWLIRTKSNHILGPVSKDKVLELYQNGSIKPDDEVCSGNGYWFFVRESDLIERYLIGSETQSFNPISEAKDVLTSSDPDASAGPGKDNITLVGGIDLNMVRQSSSSEVAPPAQIEKLEKIELAVAQKKKVKNESISKYSEKSSPASQNYLKHLAYAILIILILMIYFRKSILKSFFSESVFQSIPSLIFSTALAQDEGLVKKKKLLEAEVVIGDATFRPQIGLEGLRVTSAIDVDKFTCQQLDNHVIQLAVILYPGELFNEKFLIKVRDCMLKLNETHPVKRWLKSQATVKPTSEEQQQIDFLNEILNSQFNLITDQKVKNQVASLIGNVPGNTHVEKVLLSYLYMMIGNITRSDNILQALIVRPPREFYKGYDANPSIYHKQTMEHLGKVLKKLSRHPANRLTFYLFNQYIKHYLNHPELIALINEVETSELMSKTGLAYTKKVAPDLVAHIRLLRMDEKRRIQELRSNKYSLEMQSYWVWPFVSITPLISEITAQQVKSLDKSDPLWSIYLTDNEKLADLYFKKGGMSLSSRRKFLRENLKDKDDFMLTLYKLVDLGDIDATLVDEVLKFMAHE